MQPARSVDENPPPKGKGQCFGQHVAKHFVNGVMQQRASSCYDRNTLAVAHHRQVICSFNWKLRRTG